MNEAFAFHRSRVVTEPFLHFVAPEFMEESAAERLLGWFEREAPWRIRHEEGFYDSHDVNLRDCKPDPGFLIDQAFLEHVGERVGALMNARLRGRIDVSAHKLVPGFRIAIHSDFGTTGQTHRLLVNVNRGWKGDHGGLSMFFHTESPVEPSERDRYYAPVHRSALCFEVSPRSYHAVSIVERGERYTLCISFYGDQG